MSVVLKRFKWIAGVLVCLVLIGGAGVTYWLFSSSAKWNAALFLRTIDGVGFDGISETAPGKVSIRHFSYRLGETEFFCEGVDALLVRDGDGFRPRSVIFPELLSAKFPTSAVALGRVLGDFPLPQELVIRNGRVGEVDFELSWKPDDRGHLGLVFRVPSTGFQVTGELDPVTRIADLRFSGKLTPELLKALGSRIPAELELPGAFELSGTGKCDFRNAKMLEPFIGEVKFPENTSVSGGVWALAPGQRVAFRWNGDGQPWEIVLPEAELSFPLPIPLGMLTVSGGEGSEIRFSIAGTPPVGELAGKVLIDGRYNRENGSWMFRQSGSSDRVLRWNCELPFGAFGTSLRAMQLTGGGTRSHGSLEYALEFDEFRFRPSGRQEELQAQAGTLSGSWSFDFDNPESAGFDLSGTLAAPKLEWPNPQSAWSAASARVFFRLSRRGGEPEIRLNLEPEAAGMNLYGGDLPKVKFENFSGKFEASLDPADPGRWPSTVGGNVGIGRLRLVNSILGAGEVVDLRLTGKAALSREGAVLSHAVSGRASSGVFRYPQCEFSASELTLSSRFDRYSMTPGDNYLCSLETGSWSAAAFGGTFSSAKARVEWSGELRNSELLPDQWAARLRLPAGHMENRELTGGFSGIDTAAEFNHGRFESLRSVMRDFELEWGGELSTLPGWKFRIPEQHLEFRKSPEGYPGTFTMADGILSGTVSGNEVLTAGKIAMNLALDGGADGMAGSGRFEVGLVKGAGNLVERIAGPVNFTDGALSFSGLAASPYWSNDALELRGALRRGRNWNLTGDFKLLPTILNKPLPLGEILPVAAGVQLAGKLAASGSFELFRGGTSWSCELRPDGAVLTGKGIEIRQLSGSVRLPGSGGASARAGGELKFAEALSGNFSLQQGNLTFRLPQMDECEFTGASASVWGGQARLMTPPVFRVGQQALEWNVAVRNVEFGKLMELLGLPAGAAPGRGDGTLFFRIYPDGRAPKLVSAELSSLGVENLKLADLEPFVVSSTGVAAARQRMVLAALRDFRCRDLRLRLEEEQNGGYLLNVAVAGRPAKAIQIQDESVRRLLGTVDPSMLGLDGEWELAVAYRLPASPDREEKKK